MVAGERLGLRECDARVTRGQSSSTDGSSEPVELKYKCVRWHRTALDVASEICSLGCESKRASDVSMWTVYNR